MPETTSKHTPLAIWGGSVLIAAAIYFRPVADPGDRRVSARAPAASVESFESSNAASSRPSKVSVEPDRDQMDRAKAEEAAKGALDEAHENFERTCWRPVAAAHPEAETGEVSAGITFGRDGRQIGWAVSPLDREQASGELARCLRKLPMNLTIPAPGRVVHVQSEMQFR